MVCGDDEEEEEKEAFYRLFIECNSKHFFIFFLIEMCLFFVFFLHRKRQIERAGLDKWGRTNTLFTSSVSHLYMFCLVFHLFSYNKAQKAIRHIQCLLLLAIILSQPVPIIKHAGRAFDVVLSDVHRYVWNTLTQRGMISMHFNPWKGWQWQDLCLKLKLPSPTINPVVREQIVIMNAGAAGAG